MSLVPVENILSEDKTSLKTQNSNVDITLSTLRDAITKTGETVKTLADIVDALVNVKVNIDQTTPGTTNAIVNKDSAGTEIFTTANPGVTKLSGSIPAGNNVIGAVTSSGDIAILAKQSPNTVITAGSTITLLSNYNPIANGYKTIRVGARPSAAAGLTLNVIQRDSANLTLQVAIKVQALGDIGGNSYNIDTIADVLEVTVQNTSGGDLTLYRAIIAGVK